MRLLILAAALTVTGYFVFVNFFKKEEPASPVVTAEMQAKMRSSNRIIEQYQKEIDELTEINRPKGNRNTGGKKSFEAKQRQKRIAELQRKIAEERSKSQ